MLEMTAQEKKWSNIDAVRHYWETHIHDVSITSHEVGSSGFFMDLERYRLEKLCYLPKLVNFGAYEGRRILEVGCGAGVDLALFARLGAIVTGVDLSPTAVDLAKKNLRGRGLQADILVMNGEKLDFPDDAFDMVYAHGVLQYTPDPYRLIGEMHRVLKPGGHAVVMAYNRYSWLNLLSKLMKVDLEHEDAPFFRTYSIQAYRRMLRIFSEVEIVPERFPVKTRLHHGLKANFYNSVFVGLFNLIPRPIVRPLGWHLMARAIK